MFSPEKSWTRRDALARCDSRGRIFSAHFSYFPKGLIFCSTFLSRKKGKVVGITQYCVSNSLFTFFLDKKRFKKGQGKKRRLFFSKCRSHCFHSFPVEKKPWIKFHSTLCCSGGASCLWIFFSLTPGNAIPFILPLSLFFAGYSSLNLGWHWERLSLTQ